MRLQISQNGALKLKPGHFQILSNTHKNKGTHTFVCLFDGLNQSVLTTMGSGLQGPQGPFSTSDGRLGPSF